jgi:hypothetical protein
MYRILTLVVALVVASGWAYAQSLPSGSAMPGTSQLGIPGASAAALGGTGLPLAATEVNPGGLSPAPTSTCSTGTDGTFDGGGLSSTGCISSSSTVSASGTASPLSAPGTVCTPNSVAIPLGATDIGTAGLSPMPSLSSAATTSMVPSSTVISQPGTTTGGCTGVTISMDQPSATGC